MNMKAKKRPAPIVPTLDPTQFLKRQRGEAPEEEVKLGASVQGSSGAGMEDDNVPYDDEEDDARENEQLGQVLAILPNQHNSSVQISRRSSVPQNGVQSMGFHSASHGALAIDAPNHLAGRTPIQQSNMTMVRDTLGRSNQVDVTALDQQIQENLSAQQQAQFPRGPVNEFRI